jgi:acyl-coenzyme A thioesterase PaaI-like protein
MSTNTLSAVQDYYPDDFSHCYGCGRFNTHGHRLKTYEDADDYVARFTPAPYHMAVPGFVYGGLIASLVDCHCMAAAAAAAERMAGRKVGEAEASRFVTASLHVDYLLPTPLGPELEIRARVKEGGGRKFLLEATVTSGGTITARGEVVAVRMPESMARAAR